MKRSNLSDPYSTRDFATRWTVRLLLAIYSVIVMYPLLWNLMSSFKTNQEILISRTAWPQGFAYDNYIRAFSAANMSGFLINSIIVVVVGLALLLIFSVPLSYAMARYKFFGSRALELIFAACLFIQTIYIIIPLYSLLFNLGLLDNLIALSLVYASVSIPFTSFLLAGYMRTISQSYEEAARIDGCSNFRILLHIIVPMAKPGIITVTMLNGISFWNEYPMALVMLRNPAYQTVPIGVANLFERQMRATDFGALYAALIMVLVPVVIIYLIGQRHLIRGIGAGGIKE